MRNRQLSVRQSLCFVLVAGLLAVSGTTVRADPEVLPTSPNQVAVGTQTWDEHMREVIRRLYQQIGGNPAELDGKPIKSATLILTTRFTLFGLPNDLSADDLAQIEKDSLDLAQCAEWEPGPTEGTSYALIVALHDVGKAIYVASLAY